ncbi:low temperature requirement protein A [Lachnoclostridium sp. MSJ-17]|uniref:low temperature requirement protein A n=1 Tax=Lachnoclostridium sp. MSJ-17 TaxID=2841516 RepID=UPI001C0F7EC6|nr:low temperature requirement protein A [Lachnoclostridium sp. MSJ-17]
MKKEKKVEYLELIYDLIFVFIIGRNNALLHHVDNGYVTQGSFFAYVVCTLAVIQIWNFTTFYINIYGRNGVRDHVFLFINMYLLYHMADGISVGWESSFYRFNIAWALILVNIGVQHIIELRNQKDAPWETLQLKRKAAILFTEAALVGVHVLVYSLTGVSVAYIPIAFGIVATILSGNLNRMVPVDFAHLSERAMLYVVFTFGEMIISLSSYFTGEITVSGIYFSTMGFLIVVGLLLSYGVLYNRIIDRETITHGTGYMMIHVFMIFALNNISVALEFMRDGEVNLLQKTVLLVGSMVLYFTFMFLTEKYAKHKCAFTRKNALTLCAFASCFIASMLLLRELPYANIAVTVIFVYAVFIMLYLQGKRAEQTL